MYSEEYSNADSVCPRINIFEKDEAGFNQIGKQVGIYWASNPNLKSYLKFRKEKAIWGSPHFVKFHERFNL